MKNSTFIKGLIAIGALLSILDCGAADLNVHSSKPIFATYTVSPASDAQTQAIAKIIQATDSNFHSLKTVRFTAEEDSKELDFNREIFKNLVYVWPKMGMTDRQIIQFKQQLMNQAAKEINWHSSVNIPGSSHTSISKADVAMSKANGLPNITAFHLRFPIKTVEEGRAILSEISASLKNIIKKDRRKWVINDKAKQDSLNRTFVKTRIALLNDPKLNASASARHLMKYYIDWAQTKLGLSDYFYELSYRWGSRDSDKFDMLYISVTNHLSDIGIAGLENIHKMPYVTVTFSIYQN